MNKKCKICDEIKPFNQFYIDSRSSKGSHRTECKQCSKEKAKKWFRSPEGWMSKIYSTQKRSSKKRNHPSPTYTKKELGDITFRNPIFKKLFKDWIESKYNKDLTPSYNRKDDNLPYTLNNIELTTWKNNDNLGNIALKNGYGKNSKKVIGTHLKTGEIITFESAELAAKYLGLKSGSAIRQLCRGLKWRKSVKGYSWENTNRN